MDDSAEAEVSQIITLVRSIRNVRAQLRINPRQELQASLDHQGHDYLVGDEAEAVKGLARLQTSGGADSSESSQESGVVKVVAGEVVVALPLGEVTDLAEERRRLEGERDEASKHLKRVDSRACQAAVSRQGAGARGGAGTGAGAEPAAAVGAFGGGSGAAASLVRRSCNPVPKS